MITVIQCEPDDLEKVLRSLDDKNGPVIVEPDGEPKKLPDKLPPNCKLRLSTAQKAKILQMHAEGFGISDILAAIGNGVNGRQISGVIQGAKYPIQSNIKAKREDTTAWLAEASQKLMERGSTKPVVIPHKNCEAFTRTIPEALKEMVGKKYSVVAMMTMLNTEFGTNFTKDDITKMRSEL